MTQFMRELMQELFPVCRSISGDGVRESLAILRRFIPLEIKEVATGTRVFDWSIPREWNIRDAFIKDASGEKIIDFKKSNLHVLNYSAPVKKIVNLAELNEHLFTDPLHPQWVPYRTSYYKEQWGFCMSHEQKLELTDGEYEVFIDSELKNGSLSYGELLISGQSDEEVFFSCHICHPSLCNDNLSGIAIAVMMARMIAERANRFYSYRFVFVPGTIGSITWLSLNEKNTSNISYGLVLTLLGDPGNFTYKRSRRGNALIDQVVEYVLKTTAPEHRIIDFSPYGYDERQYCSPGFNLPVGCLMRTPHAEYPEYHTSADNLDFVKDQQMSNSLSLIEQVVGIIELNHQYLNLNPKCEPQLGSRGLYEFIGGRNDSQQRQLAMLWVLNLSDGDHSLLDIAKRSGISFQLIAEMAEILRDNNLLKQSSAQ